MGSTTVTIKHGKRYTAKKYCSTMVVQCVAGAIVPVSSTSTCTSVPVGSCFPAGMPVLMADGSWKEISTIKTGDRLMGPDGPWIVDSLYITKLGNRRMYKDSQGDMIWSEEHPLWVKRDGQQWWWSAGKEAWLKEVDNGVTVGLFDSKSIWDHENPTVGHLNDIWRKLSFSDVTDQYDYDTPLYMPVSESGEPGFISGYLATCGTNQWICDYNNLSWSLDKFKSITANINIRPIPKIDEFQLNSHWGLACANMIREKAAELRNIYSPAPAIAI